MPCAPGRQLAAIAILTALATPLAAQEPTSLATAAALERLLTEAIQRAERSVVAIARVRRDSPPVPPGAVRPPIAPGLPLREPVDPSYVPSEFGTGVVIDAKGLIVTNFHVVGDHRVADYFVWIRRTPYAARLKAADPWLDLAVLQIEADDLRPIALGDSRKLKKGQFVISLGNPYAIARDGQPSASWGIVANLDRQAPLPAGSTRPGEGRETLHHWGTLIQTDCRLELGASGGALINLQGEMVGLTTALAALAGYERPGGFAIPVNDDFRRALDSLKTGRLPDYGFLGVAPQYLTVEERQQGRQGARVADVVPATPAAAAGLHTGDLITHLDGEPVADNLDLIRRVSGLMADTPVTLQVVRDGDRLRRGRTLTMHVTLSKKRLESSRAPFAEAAPPAWRGLTVEYATAAPLFRERSRDLESGACVGVVEVARDSPAWKAGLRPGDFIARVGQMPVATPRQFFAAVEGLVGEVAVQLAGVPAEKATRTVPES